MADEAAPANYRALSADGKKATSTTNESYSVTGGGDMADNVDIRKVFEAIAKIIGDREHVDITVVAIHKKGEQQNTKEETA